MKIAKKVLFLFFMPGLFCSCYNSAFNEIVLRTTDDPFDDKPAADSLSSEHTVYLTWKEDAASDKFYLMRAFDAKSPVWSCIYKGTETYFTDKELINNGKYIYRLDKTRGKKYFKGTEYGYGWSSESIKDYCESNDTPDDATFLEYDRICNLPCAGFLTDSKQILDEDWFYVTVPPMRQAEIVVDQHNLENAACGANTNLRIQVQGFESQPVMHLNSYQIQNAGYETKNFYFKIFPEKTSLSSENSFCTVIEYTVSLNQIIKY